MHLKQFRMHCHGFGLYDDDDDDDIALIYIVGLP
ncbi:MAG: hypothetical protein ACI90V_007094 [Bacillariaceae sp.]|jgi:hypothetical protein